MHHSAHGYLDGPWTQFIAQHWIVTVVSVIVLAGFIGMLVGHAKDRRRKKRFPRVNSGCRRIASSEVTVSARKWWLHS